MSAVDGARLDLPSIPLDTRTMPATQSPSQDRGDDAAIGYVECAECGQPIELHTLQGLGACTERWTRAEITEVRKRRGLPSRFNKLELAG